MIPLLLLACAPAPAPEPAPAPKPTGPPNILLVSIDTLRADHTTPYGYPRDTTPVLAAMAKAGTLYTEAFSQANESAWSHAALFTGRYATELAAPVYSTYAIPPDATLLPEALGAYGYATAAFSAGGHVTADFGYDQGWDVWSAEPGFGSFFDTGPRAVDWVGKVPKGKPWFVFLHGYDAHRPYSRPGPWNHLYAKGEGSPLAETMCKNPCISEMVIKDALFPDIVPSWFTHKGGDTILDPETYKRLAAAGTGAPRVQLTDADKQHIQDHYDGAVRYADTMLGLTLERLEALGQLENTVVILLSDHGEDLLDHGYMNHRTGLFDSCTHVPLIVWGPGFENGGRVDGLVEGRDVAATVLALAGAKPPAGSAGRDLRDVRAGKDAVDAVFAEGVMDMIAVRTATHRLVYKEASLLDKDYVATLAATPPDSAHFELYDLRSDPGEQHDVHLADPATTATLRDALVRWRSGITVGSNAVAPDQIDPAVLEDLRRHGYFDAADDAHAPAAPAAPPPSPATPTPVPGAPGGPPAGAVGAKVLPAANDAACQERFNFMPSGK